MQVQGHKTAWLNVAECSLTLKFTFSDLQNSAFCLHLFIVSSSHIDPHSNSCFHSFYFIQSVVLQFLCISFNKATLNMTFKQRRQAKVVNFQMRTMNQLWKPWRESCTLILLRERLPRVVTVCHILLDTAIMTSTSGQPYPLSYHIVSNLLDLLFCPSILSYCSFLLFFPLFSPSIPSSFLSFCFFCLQVYCLWNYVNGSV